VYVRYLRRRLLDLELAAARQQQQQHAGPSASQLPGGLTGQGEGEVFSLAAVREAVAAEVARAAQCPEEERRRRIKQLRLRWHPDQNPMLTGLATEVTKMINAAVERLETDSR
jgi:hypothetical protein